MIFDDSKTQYQNDINGKPSSQLSNKVTPFQEQSFERLKQQSEDGIEIVSFTPVLQRHRASQDVLEAKDQVPNNNEKQKKKSVDYDFVLEDENQLFLSEDQTLFNDKKDEEQVKSKAYNGQWKWKQFFLSMISHLLFYLVLGPFSVIILKFITGVTLQRNFRFLGMSRNFIVQTILWLIVLTTSLMFFIIPNNTTQIEELILVWSSMSIRSVVISAKYATLSESAWQDYMTKIIDEDAFNKDLFLGNWRVQTYYVINEEITSTIRRNNIEIQNFKFDFMVQPVLETQQKFQHYQEQLNKAVLGEDDKQKSENFDSSAIIYMIKKYQEINREYSIPIAFGIGFGSSITPLILYAFQGRLQNASGLDIFRLCLNIFTIFFGLALSYIFLIHALVDLDRKIYCLNQCAYLISEKKLNLGVKKLLPTLNFFDPEQLQNWNYLRALFLDYGLRYYLRSQGFISIIFLMTTGLLIYYLILIFDFYRPELFGIVLLSEQALFYVIYIILFLLKAAKINSFFAYYLNLMEDIKSLVTGLRRSKDIYFEQKVIPNFFLYQFAVNFLNKKTKGDLNKIEEYLERLEKQVDHSLMKITQDERNNSISLYGVAISHQLIQQAGVGLSTLLGFAVQQRYQMDVVKSKFNEMQAQK